MANNSHGSAHSTPQGTAHGPHAEDHQHHLIPFDVYIKIFATLILLTAITVGAAQIDFGTMNTIIAFGIATVKATLVLGFFMHLKYDNMMNRVIILCGAFFLLVMYFFCAIDEATRIIQHSTL